MDKLFNLLYHNFMMHFSLNFYFTQNGYIIKLIKTILMNHKNYFIRLIPQFIFVAFLKILQLIMSPELVNKKTSQI